jgi:hypothetical protein
MCEEMKKCRVRSPNAPLNGVIGDPALQIAKAKTVTTEKGGTPMAAEEIKVYSTPT